MKWNIVRVADDRWQVVDDEGTVIVEDATREAAVSALQGLVQSAMQGLADMPETPDGMPLPGRGARFEMTFMEGEQTVDRRVIDPGATNFNRQPPLPLMVQTENAPGHMGAELAGVIDTAERQGNRIVLQGYFDAGCNAGCEAERLVREGVLTTWSPDIGDATSVIVVPGGGEPDEDDLMAMLMGPDDAVEHLTQGTLIGGTMVPFPALSSAHIGILAAAGVWSYQPTIRLVVEEAETFGPTGSSVSDAAWDGSSSRFDDEQYKMATAACDPGDTPPKTRCFLPHHEPGGAVNRNGVHAAAQRVGALKGHSADAVARAKAHLRSHYTKDLKEDPPDSIKMSAPALRAGGADVRPPAAWFVDPALDGPTPLTVTDDGRVFGHLATWGTCHIGRADICLTAPTSKTDYSYFLTGAVVVDNEVDGCDECGKKGQTVATGAITLGTGHAALVDYEGNPLNPRAAASHYDDATFAVADVAAGEDAYGIWIAGALRPGITDEQVRALRGSALSGDWRKIGGNLELVAALAVNVPGFPIPRTQALAAAGDQFALVAAGVVSPTSPTRTEIAALRAEVASLRSIVMALRPVATRELDARMSA